VVENLKMDWRAYAILSALFAAMTAIFGKLGVAEINSDLATFLRTIVVVALCACIVTARGAWQNPADIAPKGMAYLTLSGLATGLSWICYYRAMQTGPASRVAPIDKLSVVVVVVLAATFLGERLSWKTGLGAILVSAGAALMAF
jgi:bacterial/archaeal transporter family protein